MIFDTHTHYDDKQYDEDRDELLTALKDKGVGMLVNNSYNIASSKESIGLARRYPFIRAAVGIHPENADEYDKGSIDVLRELAKEREVLAIGEIGLDYHFDDNPSKDIQLECFRAQLDLALEMDMPVVIHSRDAAADTMDILKDAYTKGLICDVHCYSYSPEQALEYVKMGFYIGVGGVVTFKNSKKLKETVRQIPLQRILLETDCPYMAPVPFRGSRNSSELLSYVAEEIAAIKGVDKEEVIRVTYDNACDFYRIEK